jgi:hypothetical protein
VGIMGNPLSFAVGVAKRTFEESLTSVGRAVKLKRRLPGLPATANSAVSSAFGEKDFREATETYEQYSEDPALWDDEEDLRLLTELNRQQSGQEMVNLTEGQVMAYLAIGAGVKQGDLIIMDGLKWLVIGARVAMVDVYATAALKKVGVYTPAPAPETGPDPTAEIISCTAHSMTVGMGVSFWVTYHDMLVSLGNGWRITVTPPVGSGKVTRVIDFASSREPEAEHIPFDTHGDFSLTIAIPQDWPSGICRLDTVIINNQTPVASTMDTTLFTLTQEGS